MTGAYCLFNTARPGSCAGAASFIFSALTPWHATQVSKAADIANQIAAEAIAAIRTVAAFSMEAELALQFRLELDKPWKKFVETALVTGLAYGSSFCVIFLVSTFLRTLVCAPCIMQC